MESDVSLFLQLFEESTGTVDIGNFVIALQQEDILRVEDLVAEKEHRHFEGLLTPVHVVAQEEHPSAGRGSSHVHEADQVMQLAVDIAKYDQRSLIRG